MLHEESKRAEYQKSQERFYHYEKWLKGEKNMNGRAKRSAKSRSQDSAAYSQIEIRHRNYPAIAVHVHSLDTARNKENLSS